MAKFLTKGLLAGAVLAASCQLYGAQQVPVISVQGSSQGNTGYSSNSELVFMVQQLQDEVRQLRGQLEAQEYKIQRMENDQKSRYRDLDKRLSLLLQSASVPDADAATEKPAADNVPFSTQDALANAPSSVTPDQPAKPASKPEPAGDDQADYQTAFSLVRQRAFPAAAEKFEAFVARYPDSSRLPNAYYWLGEIYLAQGSYQPAEQAFLKVINQYSTHRKAADSMYKLGVLHKQQGNRQQSMSYMTRVVNDYPNTSAARLAESVLAQ